MKREIYLRVYCLEEVKIKIEPKDFQNILGGYPTIFRPIYFDVCPKF